MSSSSRGFSLIDVIVGIALMLVLFLALFGLLRASLVLSTITKAKAAAVELASTDMEYLRGLSYSALGTVGGIPAGTVPQTATSTIDGITYVTSTFIEYVDDPADGTGTNDTNGITTDYKVGEVTVTYTIYGLTKTVRLVSNFVPQGIETTTNGGTLSIHVVDATGANMGNATVQVVNTSLSPTVNLTTYTDSAGLVTLGGAATSSQYQITVSRTGYSSAQTYARVSPNMNPTPGYLTVVMNQTTSTTFAIDKLASLALASFSPAVTTAFTDTFTSSANLASQTNTQVSGGALTLSNGAYPVGYALSGSAHSLPFSPSYLDGWGILSASIATSTGTSVVVHVDDTAGALLPDSVLPGNSVGFSSFPVVLTTIATSSYPGLSLEADLTSDATTTTPSLLTWSLSHTEGPESLPNVAFTLTGTKTIGTTSGGASLYKTIVNDTTGAHALKNESLEWDAYSLALSGGAPLIESCSAAPYQLQPGTATTTTLIIGTPTATTLPLDIVDTSSAAIPGAEIILSNATYAATELTSGCGLAYFNGLTSGNYSATVSAPGHATHIFSPIGVAGHTATTTLTLP
jgi:hypothetical protein